MSNCYLWTDRPGDGRGAVPRWTRTRLADTRTELDAEGWIQGLVEALPGWPGLWGVKQQTYKQATNNNTGTEAGPRWLTVLLSCGGGDGTVLRPNVVSFITFYSLHFVVIKHPEILTICTLFESLKSTALDVTALSGIDL